LHVGDLVQPQFRRFGDDTIINSTGRVGDDYRHERFQVVTFRDGPKSRVLRPHGRPADGEIAIMDGEAWSGVANLTHPDTVRELHTVFLAAGAQILISKTFAAGPGLRSTSSPFVI
jgi:methionine synthase I (cobalamin-dependent)